VFCTLYIATAVLCSAYKIYVYYVILEFNFVSFYHSILFLSQIHLVLHGTTFFADEGMFPLFTHLSADYRLRHFVNNVAMHIYVHVYIRMEITVLYLKISLPIFDLMVAKIRLLAPLTRR